MIERERSSKRKEVCKLVYFSFEWEGILPPPSFVLQLQYLLFIGLEIQWIYPFTWTFKIACSKIKISVTLTRGKGVILAKCSSSKKLLLPRASQISWLLCQGNYRHNTKNKRLYKKPRQSEA